MQLSEDEHWMQEAIRFAKEAEAQGEVPVGAVLVENGEMVAYGVNQSIGAHDPCGHAEVICLRRAGIKKNNYRLIGTTLYVTLEPCAMCAGALVHARVQRVVFGTKDPKTGAGGSVFQLLQSESLNHQVELSTGVLETECREQIQTFFKNRRLLAKKKKS